MKTKNDLIVFAIVLLSLWGNIGCLIAQTNWTKYATNPILKKDTVIANLPSDIIGISDCWVIKEGTTYKMWYTGGGFNYPTDSFQLRSRISYATSSDGINWIKYSGNPVLDISYTGGWDSLAVEAVSVIIDSIAPLSERYKMWYTGVTSNSPRYDIGYAYSPDGMNWTKHAGPVLQVGISVEWDNGFLEGPSVIKDGTTYKMWYCGYDNVADGNGTDGKANIGYATSPDGIIWTKSNNPVLTTGTNSWDSIYVQDPHVIKQAGMYYMWYGGVDRFDFYGQQVGFASSPDGINWTKSTANPVLTTGNAGAWDANTASFPSVLNDNGIYKMWYTGKDVDPPPANSFNYYWEIGYATAPITGVIDITMDGNRSITLFPNPFSTQTTLQTNLIFTDATLTVYNSIGQQVKQIKNISGQTISLNRDALPGGLYLIHLTEGNKVLTTQRLIITD